MQHYHSGSIHYKVGQYIEELEGTATGDGLQLPFKFAHPMQIPKGHNGGLVFPSKTPNSDLINIKFKSR